MQIKSLFVLVIVCTFADRDGSRDQQQFPASCSRRLTCPD